MQHIDGGCSGGHADAGDVKASPVATTTEASVLQATTSGTPDLSRHACLLKP